MVKVAAGEREGGGWRPSPGCAGSPRVEAPSGVPTAEAVMARAGGENFTVASRLLPARLRRHLLAFYGWARLVDQLGDDFPGDRLGALEWLEGELDVALGCARSGGRPALDAAQCHPLVARAAESVVELGQGEEDLRLLVEANRQDQTTTRYATFEALLGYCRLSARPVGHLVLAAFAASGEEVRTWSDSICDGLQLVEHWQDLPEDVRAGRVYVPGEDLRRFELDETDLAVAAASGSGALAPGERTALRALVGFETARARALLLAGTPLVDTLRGRARLAVAGFVAGGLAAVDALAAQRFDPFAGPARPRPTRVGAHTLGLLFGGAR